MRRPGPEGGRRPSLSLQLLGPLLGILVVGVVLLTGLSEVSASRETNRLVEQRGLTVLTGLAERLQEREDAQLVFGGLIASSEVVVEALAADDPVAAAQALVPRRSRFGLGFVSAHTGAGTPLLALGDPAGLDMRFLLGSGLAGIETSTAQVVDGGLVLAAAVPVKADSGIVGAILVGQLMDDASLRDLAETKEMELAVRNDGRVSASSSSLPLEEIESALSERGAHAEVSIDGVRHYVEVAPMQDGELVALVPVEDVRAATTRRRLIASLVTLAMLLLLAGTAFLRTRAIGRSLGLIAALAGRMAGGEYDRQVPRASTRELDDLGVAVNHLSDQIRSRVDDLVFHARHDALTGLANRAMLSEHVAASLSRRRGGTVGVLFIDLDNFKAINDSLGHEAGDQVITAVAGILRSHVRAEDLPARLGGDEFAVVVQDAKNEGELVALAERLVTALSAPMVLGQHQVVPSASIGISTAQTGSGDVETLLRNSDVAMYLAKQQGKRRYALFHPDMHADIVDRLLLKADLARALDAGELTLHYQPLVELSTGLVAGVEALLRWNHPTRGAVPPVTFIPLAEETGLIEPIGRWVLREACLQAADWRAEGTPAMHVSVNLSVRQLQSPSITQDITDALTNADLPARLLTLEITESVLMQDGAVPDLLGKVRSLGVRLAIDDFGTGYSSLAYLQRFPVDTIKIDRSFVTPLDGDGSGALVRSIIELAGALGAQTVAEGIESQEQADALRRLGCGIGQGYLFARPMPAADITRYLASPRATARDLPVV